MNGKFDAAIADPPSPEQKANRIFLENYFVS
jgi:hypothetical protein